MRSAHRCHRETVAASEQQHAAQLRIGMRALERLREQRPEQLHSRKLRSFAEVAFR